MAEVALAIATKAGEWVGMTVFQGLSGTIGVTAAAAVATAAQYATAGLVLTGIALGAGALVTPSIPGAEQGKVPVNQTTPLRRIGTGRARLSGPRMVWEAIAGWNIELIYLHEGPVDAFEQFWLNDDPVTPDAGGWVPTTNGRYGSGDDIRILYRHGNADDDPFHEVVALFEAAGQSELYDDSCWGKGIAKMVLLCKAVKDTTVLQTYPNGPPLLSATVRLSRVYDWRDPDQELMDPGTWKWSENAVVNHVHFEWLLRHLPILAPNALGGPTGWIQGDGRPPPAECVEAWHADIAPRLETWTQWADHAEDPVPLKAGGTEPRYRQGGWWFIGTEEADIRRKFLDCYDGWMAEGADGALVVQGGGYVAPDYALTDRNLIEASWTRWAPDRSTINILIGNYTSPEHGFSPQEAQAWRDETSIARVGEKPTSINLEWVHYHGQARRLLKAFAARLFVEHRAELVCDLEGLNAQERRYIQMDRKRGPLAMRTAPIEVLGSVIDLTQGRVIIQGMQADPAKYSWNAATEEGDGPGFTSRADVVTPPLPEILSAEAVGDATGVRILVTLADPDRPGLTYAAGWRPVGSVSWVETSPQDPVSVDGGLQIGTGVVPQGALEVRVQSWSGGSASPWTDPPVAVDTAVAAPTPPATDLMGVVTGNELTLSWRYPQTPFGYVKVTQGDSPDGGAELPEALTGALGAMDAVVIEDLEPGALWFAVTAYSSADVASVPLGPVQVNVVQEPDANLLSDPSDLTSANWEKGQNGTGSIPIVTANAGAAPDGTTTADRIQFVTAGIAGDASDHAFVRQLPAGAGAGAHGSVWLKSNTGADQTVYLRCDGEQHAVTVKPYWQRLTPPSGTGTLSLWLGLRGNITGTAASADVLVWGAHLALD